MLNLEKILHKQEIDNFALVSFPDGKGVVKQVGKDEEYFLTKTLSPRETIIAIQAKGDDKILGITENEILFADTSLPIEREDMVVLVLRTKNKEGKNKFTYVVRYCVPLSDGRYLFYSDCGEYPSFILLKEDIFKIINITERYREFAPPY